MKLFLTLLSPIVLGAVTIDHQKASELLKREPRANEGLSEVRILFVKKSFWSQFLAATIKSFIQMWESVGSLERECIEEDCDEQEFHEVYDNLAVSNPLLMKYDKCKQVVWLKNDSCFLTSYISVCREKSWTQS